MFGSRRLCDEFAQGVAGGGRGYGGGIEGCSAANTGQNRMRAEYVIRGIFGALVRVEEGFAGREEERREGGREGEREAGGGRRC